MVRKKKILVCGESCFTYTTAIQGLDTITSIAYEEKVCWLRNALREAGYEVEYLASHLVANKFPICSESLSKYDLVILSDIGSSSLAMPDASYRNGELVADRFQLIVDYIKDGGGLVMVGGFMSFTGYEGKARYGMTPLADILPVDLLPFDDRVEMSSGAIPEIVDVNHEIFEGFSKEFPSYMAGYNKTLPNFSKGQVIALINGDPFIAVGEQGKGRVVAFTSDCAPHWAPESFLKSNAYKILWKNIADWVSRSAD